MEQRTTELTRWIGHDLVDANGSKIGSIDDLYVDDRTRRPEWLAVRTGLFGSHQSFVPLRGAASDGDVLVTPYDKDVVKDAPRVEPDGDLSAAEEARLYEHYAMAAGAAGVDAVEASGRDTSRPETDTATTRSEEELRVGTRDVEAGRVRLRKYVVTEHESVTVPVRKERVRVEREPITGDDDAAVDGPAISEEEHEIVLHEERPVVATETVPKERVRLEADTEVSEETVEADVRKERVEVDGDVEAGRRR